MKGQVENAELPLGSIKNYYDNGKIRFQFCNGKTYTDPHKYTLLLISTHKSFIVVFFSVILTGKVARHSEMSSSHLCLLENNPYSLFFFGSSCVGLPYLQKSGQALDDRKEPFFFFFLYLFANIWFSVVRFCFQFFFS